MFKLFERKNKRNQPAQPGWLALYQQALSSGSTLDVSIYWYFLIFDTAENNEELELHCATLAERMATVSERVEGKRKGKKTEKGEKLDMDDIASPEKTKKKADSQKPCKKKKSQNAEEQILNKQKRYPEIAARKALDNDFFNQSHHNEQQNVNQLTSPNSNQQITSPANQPTQPTTNEQITPLANPITPQTTNQQITQLANPITPQSPQTTNQQITQLANPITPQSPQTTNQQITSIANPITSQTTNQQITSPAYQLTRPTSNQQITPLANPITSQPCNQQITPPAKRLTLSTSNQHISPAAISLTPPATPKTSPTINVINQQTTPQAKQITPPNHLIPLTSNQLTPLVPANSNLASDSDNEQSVNFFTDVLHDTQYEQEPSFGELLHSSLILTNGNNQPNDQPKCVNCARLEQELEHLKRNQIPGRSTLFERPLSFKRPSVINLFNFPFSFSFKLYSIVI